MKATSKANHGGSLNQGSITCTKDLGLIPRIPDLEGTRPMLLADLSHEIGKPRARVQWSVGAEVVLASEQALYLFRLQVGATLVCWLADPSDPKVVGMLQEWASAKHMFFGLRTKGGVIVRTREVVGVPLTVDEISAALGGVDRERFIRSATEVVNSGLIKAKAQSDILAVSKIRKLRIFTVLSAEANRSTEELPA